MLQKSDFYLFTYTDIHQNNRAGKEQGNQSSSHVSQAEVNNNIRCSDMHTDTKHHHGNQCDTKIMQ